MDVAYKEASTMVADEIYNKESNNEVTNKLIRKQQF